MNDSPKLQRNLNRLCDIALSEGVLGTANSAARQRPDDEEAVALVAAAHEFAACARQHLATLSAGVH
jgi:hypothetical protein